MDKGSAKERELRALMIASQSGDDASHRRLLSELAGYLRGFFRNRLLRARRASEETEDLVQEALLAIHNRRGTYDPSELLTPWVYAIARYKLIDHLRKSQSQVSDVPLENASEVMAADDQSANESSIDLGRLLAMLPEKVSMSIQYVKVDGLTVAEAAARCHLSESAVKINIHRGLKALSALVSRVNIK